MLYSFLFYWSVSVIVIIINVIIHIGLKEGITQRHASHIADLRVFQKVRIDEKEHWHVDSLTWQESLLLETEALNLLEIQAYFGRMYVIRRHSCNGLVRMIRYSKEGECCLARDAFHV